MNKQDNLLCSLNNNKGESAVVRLFAVATEPPLLQPNERTIPSGERTGTTRQRNKGSINIVKVTLFHLQNTFRLWPNRNIVYIIRFDCNISNYISCYNTIITIYTIELLQHEVVTPRSNWTLKSFWEVFLKIQFLWRLYSTILH